MRDRHLQPQDPFADAPERRGNRLLGHGDLKLLLLVLLNEAPGHGYELIRRIADMFHGHYTPSPGAIYPTLTMLEELRLLQAEQTSGSRRRYAITPAGRRYLVEQQEAVNAMALRTRHAARTAAKMAMPPAVRQAMHALKHALMSRGTSWNAIESKRVAALLEQAASDIATPHD
ncbi:MAG TPA: PadR family transcriptional regulator [Dyella sp.]|uniref:PadR family transcriptional regulator n=1 Tax=Dyella sp. TaxID=1869338 RepID=UPI002D772F65|nr:PadR family transcriptional regulator [Dyella sp.]HET6552009.1 PadR family transcriptional regulator [Dyella sp.]